MRLLQFLHPARHRSLSFTGNSLYPNFITRDPVTPVGPATVTGALLLLVFCDICSSSLSLSFESLDSIHISNFHYCFQDGRPTRYYNHRYYKPYNIYDYNRRTWQDYIIFIDAKQYDCRKDISRAFCVGTRGYGVPGNENDESIVCMSVLYQYDKLIMAYRCNRPEYTPGRSKPRYIMA